MRNPLDFVRDKQALEWKNGVRVIVPEPQYIDEGIIPVGSTWVRARGVCARICLRRQLFVSFFFLFAPSFLLFLGPTSRLSFFLPLRTTPHPLFLISVLTLACAILRDYRGSTPGA